MGSTYRAGCAVPVTCQVVFGTIGAACGRGNAAVEDWFEISSFGAGWVWAAGLSFGRSASVEGAYSRVLVVRFDMAEPSGVLTLLGGGRGVGFFDDIVATEDGDSGEVG